MKQQPSNIDPLFAGLNQHEATPPSAAWQQMEALLDAQAPAPQKKRVAAWWWAAAVLLPFLMGGFWFLGRQSAGTQEVAATNVETPKEARKVAIQPAAPTLELKAQLPPRNPALHEKKIASPHITTNHFESGFSEDIAEPRQPKGIAPEPVLSPAPGAYAASEKAMPADQSEPMAAIQNATVEKEAPSPTLSEKRTDAVDANATEIAIIEIRRSKAAVPATEVASVEWRPSRSRTSLGEKLQRLRNTDPGKWPGLGQAKENLFAWIVPKR